MPRKPLTDDQLRACLDAGGQACPRCQNDDFGEMTRQEIEIDPDGNPYQLMECYCCHEEWVVTYRAVKVEPAGDGD